MPSARNTLPAPRPRTHKSSVCHVVYIVLLIVAFGAEETPDVRRPYMRKASTRAGTLHGSERCFGNALKDLCGPRLEDVGVSENSGSL